MRDRSKRFYSSLICTECGLVMTIPRPRSQRRKEGHIKTMYCAVCKDKRDFIENNYKRLGVKNEENKNII